MRSRTTEKGDVRSVTHTTDSRADYFSKKLTEAGCDAQPKATKKGSTKAESLAQWTHNLSKSSKANLLDRASVRSAVLRIMP